MKISIAIVLSYILQGAGAVAVASPKVIITQFRHGPDHAGVFEGASPGNLVQKRWSFDAGSRIVSSPVVSAGTLFIGTSGGQLLALDSASGALRWSFKADGPVTSTPAIADDVVVFQSAANTVFGVRAKDGKQLWRRTTGKTVEFHSIPALPDAPDYDIWVSSPLIQDGSVFIGSGDGNLYALDLLTGAQRWNFHTGGRIRATPASDGTSIFVGSFDGVMYALDPKSGQLTWTFKTAGNSDFPVGSIQSSAAIADGMVFFGSRDYHLYALDAGTGRLAWKNLHKDSWVVASPAVSNGRVFAGSSDGRLIRCNDARTGVELWTRAVDGNVYSSPALVGRVLFAGTFQGTILGLRAADGAIAAGITLMERVYSSMWIEGGVLYVATGDGVIFAFSNGTIPGQPAASPPNATESAKSGHSKEFWRKIAQDNYRLPAGESATSLIQELAGLLGSPDPELRDEFGYAISASWIYRDHLFAPNEVERLARVYEDNLKAGVGETGGDSVLRRSFSALVLSTIAALDNKQTTLSDDAFRTLLDSSLNYMAAERDLRGYDPEKGWLHATAHTADLLKFLGRSPRLRSSDQGRILDAIGGKLKGNGRPFVFGENERMAAAVLSLVLRKDSDEPAFEAWLNRLVKEGEGLWSQPKLDTAQFAAVQNIKDLLRSLLVQLSGLAQPAPVNADSAKKAILDRLAKFR